jgi:hypothetical protein
MKVICEYCGTYTKEDETSCIKCGAPINFANCNNEYGFNAFSGAGTAFMFSGACAGTADYMPMDLMVGGISLGRKH